MYPSTTHGEQILTTCFNKEFLGILGTFNTPTVIYKVLIALFSMVLTAYMWFIVYVMKCIRRISAVYCIPYASESV